MKHFILLIPLFFSNGIFSQPVDSLVHRKNLVKYNLSAHALYSTSFILGYERLLKGNRTIGISAGYIIFPNLIFSDSLIKTKDNLKRSGFTFSGEYRYYLLKENKHPVPRGVYLGPYFSCYHFNNLMTLNLTDSSIVTEGELSTKLNIVNLGFQVGYQFVFKDRWSIDLIFAGPSLSMYMGKFKLDTDLNLEQENEIMDGITGTFPVIGDLINEEEVKLNKTNLSWGPGYRYLIQVGYKFGGRKK